MKIGSRRGVVSAAHGSSTSGDGLSSTGGGKDELRFEDALSSPGGTEELCLELALELGCDSSFRCRSIVVLCV